VLQRPTIVLVSFGLAAVSAGAMRLSIDLAAERALSEAVRRSVSFAAVAGFVVLSICGYAAGAGAGVLALIAVIAATSPNCLAYVAGEPRAVTKRDAVPPDRSERADLQPLDGLSDLELCTVWRRSYQRLQRAESPAARLVIVERRQDILDELGRRDPDHLAEWLRAGPRAAGDPAKYFRHLPPPD
jgi:hypothetical protein